MPLPHRLIAKVLDEREGHQHVGEKGGEPPIHAPSRRKTHGVLDLADLEGLGVRDGGIACWERGEGLMGGGSRLGKAMGGGEGEGEGSMREGVRAIR